MWKSFFKISLGIFILPFAIAATFFSLEKSGYFNLELVQVELPTFDPANRYFSNLTEQMQKDLRSFSGSSLVKINLEHVSSLLKTYTWIESYEVKRRWPSTLMIFIQTKKMVALFHASKEGRLYPVLEDGTFLTATSTDSLPDLPILQGDVFVKNPERLAQAIELLKQIPTEGRFSKQKISELKFDDKDGFWVTMIESAVKVKLGEDQFAMKASRVSQVLEYMENRDLQARVIDADLSKKVLVRLRKDP